MIPYPATFFGRRFVGQIQYGQITLASGVTSASATISAVNSRAVIIPLGYTINAISDTQTLGSAKLTLTNSTTVTCDRNTATGGVVIIQNFVIVEFTSDLVESVEYGQIAVDTGLSGTATISSIDTSRSAVFYLGTTGGGAGTTAAARFAVTITDSTTITATNPSLMGVGTTNFVVVQFRANVIKSVQQFSNAFTTTNAADTQTISSVVMANSMIVSGGIFSNAISNYAMEITAATTVTLTRVDTTNTTRTPRYAVVEFQPRILRTIQRGRATLTSLATLTTNLNEINNKKSLINFCGWQFGATGQPSAKYSKSTFNAGVVGGAQDSMTSTINANTAAVKAFGYEVLEFM